jgi:dynein heavy chain, axonemal
MGMISAEKETVPFKNKIDVNEGDRKGNVEIWLLEIERTMIETLQNITKDSMMDLGTARTEWV